MPGSEQRFEEQMIDPAWAKAFNALAFEGIVDACIIEKALYAEARMKRYAGLSEMAAHYTVICQQMHEKITQLGLRETSPTKEVLCQFDLCCDRLARQHNSKAFVQLKEFASRDLRYRADKNDWPAASECDLRKALLKSFFKNYICVCLDEACIAAEKKGMAVREASGRN